MKSYLVPVVLAVGTAFGFGGNRDDVCAAADDLAADFVASYAACCQADPVDAGWGECIQAQHNRYQDMRRVLYAAQAAGDAGRDELKEEMLRGFYEMLRQRVDRVIRPTGLGGDLSYGGLFVVLGPDDAVSVRMTTRLSGTSVETAKPTSGAGTDGTRLSAISLESRRHEFQSGGEITVSHGAIEETLSVVKGQLTILRSVEEGRGREVPTAMVLSLSGDGVQATLTLDNDCPYNELVLDGDGSGYLGVAVSIDSDSPLLARVSKLGPVWMKLPVHQGAQGGLVFDTAGWEAGTTVFPLQDSTMTLLLRHGGEALQGLPNGRSESCADSNGNGIPDGADEIIGLYDELGSCN